MGSRPEGGGESRAAAAAGKRREEEGEMVVKVTHVVTAEVSADEASFKDVVQRLTGKDSAAARAAAVDAAGGGGSSEGKKGDAVVFNRGHGGRSRGR
uniref:VQ domain-containing protein n=1 Tax=Oryza brachyantha TaxID=4533 RepID=J3MBF2_ORYBR